MFKAEENYQTLILCSLQIKDVSIISRLFGKKSNKFASLQDLQTETNYDRILYQILEWIQSGKEEERECKRHEFIRLCHQWQAVDVKQTRKVKVTSGDLPDGENRFLIKDIEYHEIM